MVQQGFYPDPKSPDWVHHYGAIDETVPYAYEGKTVGVYHDEYGAVPTIEPMSLLVGVVIGAVAFIIFKKVTK